MEWRTPHPKIVHDCNLDAALTEWIRTVPVDVLVDILLTTPRGLGADLTTGVSYDFSFWQRASMAFYVNPFFSTRAAVSIDTATLREMAQYTPEEQRRARKIPITCELSLLGTGPRDVGIVDLPTAAGKTAWVASVGLMILTGTNWTRLVAEHTQKLSGVMFSGPMVPRVARMLLIACAASTFTHFTNTVTRLVPRVHDLDPTVHVDVWTTMKEYSTLRACADPSRIVVWIIPVSQLNAVLRQHPDVTVAVCVTDEYTQDTPRERFATDRSTVLKQIIAQATPQALQEATQGNRSWIKEVFGGSLLAPKAIRTLVQRRCWNDATLAARQLCMLDLMTLTPFRDRVRRDLAPLVPNGLHITFVRSRRVTLASHLENSEVDLVPASFPNLLLSYLRPFALDDASRLRVEEAVTNNHMVPDELETLLDGLTSRYSHTSRAPVDRLKERIQEFSQSCPICLDDAATGINIFGCCGYCVCTVCFHSCAHRCPFCRTEVRSNLPRSEVDAPEVVEQRMEERQNELYPMAPVPVTFDPGELRRHTQITNLTRSLHHLRAQFFTRTLIVVERPWTAGDISRYIDLPVMQSRTGYEITRVDHVLTGKGTVFSRIKARFDTPDPAPQALLCFGINEQFLVGTDLAYADSLVTVGTIHDNILTQALGRIFRPRRERDNSRPVPMIKIYTPSLAR